jgi:hypothetical protein
MRSQVIPMLFATLVAAVSLRGQAPPAPRAPLAFDVVSVKPNTSGEQGGTSRAQPGRYQGINVTLRRVIGLAYRPVQEFAGGPDWIDAARFDIEARTESNPSQEQMLENAPLIARKSLQAGCAQGNEEFTGLRAYVGAS